MQFSIVVNVHQTLHSLPIHVGIVAAGCLCEQGSRMPRAALHQLWAAHFVVGKRLLNLVQYTNRITLPVVHHVLMLHLGETVTAAYHASYICKRLRDESAKPINGVEISVLPVVPAVLCTIAVRELCFKTTCANTRLDFVVGVSLGLPCCCLVTLTRRL